MFSCTNYVINSQVGMFSFQQRWSSYSLEWKKTLKHCQMFAVSANEQVSHLSVKLRCIWTLTLVLLRVHERTGGSRTCAHWSLQRERRCFGLSLCGNKRERKRRRRSRGMISISESSHHDHWMGPRFHQHLSWQVKITFYYIYIYL